MKKLLVLLLVLLVGCIQQTIIMEGNDSTVVDPEIKEELVNQEDVLVDGGEPNEPSKVQGELLGVDIASPNFENGVEELVQKGLSHKQNYFYRALDNSKSHATFQIWILDQKMLLVPPRGYGDGSANRIYVDKALETAVGYCRDKDGLKCENFGPFELSFDTWNVPAPKEWLIHMTNGKYFADSTFGGRPIVVVQEQKDDVAFEVWLDRFYGIPLRILEGQEDVLLEYKDVSPGKATAKLVNPNFDRNDHLFD